MKSNNNEKIQSRFRDIVSDIIHFTAYELQRDHRHRGS